MRMIVAGLAFSVALSLGYSAWAGADEDRERLLIAAAQKLGRSSFDRCVAEYRKGLHDPAAFSVVNAKDLRWRVWAARDPRRADGWSDRVAVMTPVRGKNAYGARVLSCMACWYDYEGGMLIFTGAISSQSCN